MNTEVDLNRKLCIYHGNCADGFGAAWVVACALGGERFVDFHAGVYQTPPPDVRYRDVILVDFSYKRPVLLEMAAAARSILIIDHHKTAAADLVDLPSNVHTVFDMEHSGAMLAWMHFFPGEQPPTLLEHIEDRDLWKFKLPKTREIQAAIFSYPYDMELWDRLMHCVDEEGVEYDPENFMEKLAQEGEAIERKHFKDIEELLKVVTRSMQIGGYKMQVANLPHIFSSDAGHTLAIENTEVGIGACYWDTPEGRIFSLRSTEEGADVSAIAKQYGGGGHAHAAGFKVSYQKAAEFEVEQEAQK